jgi:hypothetical protein
MVAINRTIEVEELLPAGDRVVVVSRQHAVPRSAEKARSCRLWRCGRFRDGLLLERDSYSTCKHALEAAGLRDG